MISIGEISDKKTKVFISDLCNNTFLYIIITITRILVSILHLLNQALTIQEIFITNKSKQYNLLRFFGIMINTSILAKSIIRYN
jgi:hypothetical protein